MFAVLMAAFAFVMSVGALGVVLWTTYALIAGERAQDSRLAELAKELTKITPTSIAAEVDDLRGALDVIRASNRKEFGAIWGRLGGKPASNAIETTMRGSAPDASFEALLDLQSRPPAGPQ